MDSLVFTHVADYVRIASFFLSPTVYSKSACPFSSLVSNSVTHGNQCQICRYGLPRSAEMRRTTERTRVASTERSCQSVLDVDALRVIDDKRRCTSGTILAVTLLKVYLARLA